MEMIHLSDILKIRTEIGYATVKCFPTTTVRELIAIAMRTVSLIGSPSLYGLVLSNKARKNTTSRQILCRHLNYSELKDLYGSLDLQLTICLYPTKFEEAARNDRPTLFYLYQQAKNTYYLSMHLIKDVDMALEIGCLEIRSFVSSQHISVKGVIDVVEKVRELTSFFPPCVVSHFKGKSLRRAVQNYLSKIVHYSEEDCVLDMLNRYLILLQFDRDIIQCWLGVGRGIPVELIIGPRFQVSIKVENARQPRLLTYFASIRQILVSKIQGPDSTRYQVRLRIEQSTDVTNNQEMITFTFLNPEEADTVVHLLEGYCHEATGATAYDGRTEFRGSPKSRGLTKDTCNAFLPTGCPFRINRNSKAHLKKLEIPRNLIMLEQVLGEGQFGDVYKGLFYKQPNVQSVSVAVKACKLDASYEERKQFLEEAMILSEFDHPHIIKLFGICSDEPIWLVMEYAPLGELRHYLLSKRNGLQTSVLITFCYQIVTALACLESKKCIHRDIAARNILVSRPDCVKLADFGMAMMLNDLAEYKAEQGKKMPIKWMAPESLHHRRFSSASDVWMFGVCVWEILSKGVKPFADLTNAEAVKQIARGLRLKRPENCTPSLYGLLLECWNVDPSMRPTFASLKPRLREFATQLKSMAESLYLNYPNSAYQNQFKVTVSPNSLHPKQYMNLQSHWNQVTQLNPTRYNSHKGKLPRTNTVPQSSDQNAELRMDFDTKSSRNNGRRSHSPYRTVYEAEIESPHISMPIIPPREAPQLYVNNFCGRAIKTNERWGSPIQRRDRSSPPKQPVQTIQPKNGRLTSDCVSSISTGTSTLSRKTKHEELMNKFANLDLTDSTSRSKSAFSSSTITNSNRHIHNYPRDSGISGSPANSSPTAVMITIGRVPHQSTANVSLNRSNERASENDPVYLATVQIVKTVGLASQQLATARPDKYPILVKSIGVAVKDLFSTIHLEFGEHSKGEQLSLVECQLNSSVYRLISVTRDTKLLQLNRGPLLEEYRRTLMSLAYAVAADAHSVYTAVREARQAITTRDTH